MGRISSSWSREPVNQTQPVGEPTVLPWAGPIAAPWMPRTIETPTVPEMLAGNKPGAALQPQPGMPADPTQPPMQAQVPDLVRNQWRGAVQTHAPQGATLGQMGGMYGQIGGRAMGLALPSWLVGRR
jgi:hypothetical protein